ncbi:MAG: phosphoenolpyruvate synthase [Candidatus Aenigmatarchaeota archaeon]|nr:phosphoenolpyruvate synthase [Candidatus Aenigmarchaeota archaeon]
MAEVDKARAYILWFEQLRKGDTNFVGGKNANLGELTSAKIPVPPGFAITASAYRHFISVNKLEHLIANELRKLIDPNDTRTLRRVGATIRRAIMNAKMPPDLAKQIISAYTELGKRLNIKNPFVAVRSSATAEDLPGASFAGQQETYLNVRGTAELLDRVKACIASLFTDRAIFYRIQQGYAHGRIALSVAVQKMVNSKAAGVMFTIDPATGDESRIVIEGNWGLGEAVVSGAVTPDHWVVDKKTMKIIERDIVKKEVEYLRDPKTGHTVHMPIPPTRAKKPCLTDEEIKKLAAYGLAIEKHYGNHQDIEWAVDRDLKFPEAVFIVQARPETVWVKKKVEFAVIEKVGAAPVLKGLPASPGTASGPAKIIDIKNLDRVKPGDILVTRMTTPDYVPAMRKAAAIITDEGGATAHAAIVSRELGIPCIVGTEHATTVLKDGAIYTIDARDGFVYEGVIEKLLEKPVPLEVGKPIPTSTKIYMNLGVPEKIEEYKKLPFDGIGLMRLEFIIASYINEHPLDLIAKGKANVYVDKLAEGIGMVAKNIAPRPVVVRFSDFKTNEYRALPGGEKYEPIENNPMIGWRGASRYIADPFEKAFRLECQAIKKVRQKYKNVWVMLPFVRKPEEVQQCLKIMAEEGLKRSADFKVWLMLEVPSVVFRMDDFSKLCDGFSIGSNDLTQLIMGADRDSELLAKMGYLDERDRAVMKAIEMAIEGAKRNGKTISICGQAPSVYPEFAEWLVSKGVTSMSVNPDTVAKTRQLVAQFESKNKRKK